MPICTVCHKGVSRTALREVGKIAGFNQQMQAKNALYLAFVMEHRVHNPKWAKRWLAKLREQREVRTEE